MSFACTIGADIERTLPVWQPRSVRGQPEPEPEPAPAGAHAGAGAGRAQGR